MGEFSAFRSAKQLALVIALILATSVNLPAADISRARYQAPRDISQQLVDLPTTAYYWKSAAVSDNAQLLTLFCRACYAHVNGAEEVPLVSVLRDTLGDNVAANDRVSYVWLLSAPHIGAGQKALAAVPFFYWRVGSQSAALTERDLRPQLNVTTPQNPMMAGFTRQVLQWTAFDPLTVWVRATSRSYQSNTADSARYQLEEIISYLQHAPSADDASSPTNDQLKTVVARLELRKSMLGGLANDQQAQRYADETSFENERIRSRNWELMRQCAEKTGLYFEPMNLAGADGQYAMLWYPLGSVAPDTGSPTKSIWKLLNIRDPRTDPNFPRNHTATFTRQVDENGQLLPEGQSGRTVQLIPLGFYSLLYPKLPLLVVDFRDRLHLRRHEMTQRSINEITAGIIGISRFTNWYYYAGAMAYNFVAGRHGTAVSMAQRLDCYSQFRVHLALDRSLDQRLHAELDRRAESLGVNPLGSAATHSIQLARERYALLLSQTEKDSPLMERLNRDRRAELASFGQDMKSRVVQDAMHVLTVGIYTHRVSNDQLSLPQLDQERRFTDALANLDNAIHNGTSPEIALRADDIRASLATVTELQPGVRSSGLRAHATATVKKLADLTKDDQIMASCRETVLALNLTAPPAAVPLEPGLSKTGGGTSVDTVSGLR